MKALVGAFNQEKALVGAFSVIVQPVVEPMEHYTALVKALELTDLADSLEAGGPFTVFAPTNRAFDRVRGGRDKMLANVDRWAAMAQQRCQRNFAVVFAIYENFVDTFVHLTPCGLGLTFADLICAQLAEDSPQAHCAGAALQPLRAARREPGGHRRRG